jgi:NAD(P)H-dependent FMN reductase/ketosteroid isomerase-like protein
MVSPTDVVLLVGSLREESLTRKIALALVDVAPARLRCRLVKINDLPMYDEDLDGAPPEAWTRFRKEIATAQAVMLLTPEYNRSIPGCLKNALDVASRPEGRNLWDGKPAAVVSVTPYKLGAFGANHHVRQTLVFLNMPVMQQPEAYIGNAADLFDRAGILTSEETHKFLAHFMRSFDTWITTIMGNHALIGFDEFLKKRDEIARAYSSGDARPLDGIVSENGKATFFSPSGDAVTGSQEVRDRYDKDAACFTKGATSKLEYWNSDASGKLAFWTGFQFFDGAIRGKQMRLKLRITEVFRLSEGGWKLIHRHADSVDQDN